MQRVVSYRIVFLILLLSATTFRLSAQSFNYTLYDQANWSIGTSVNLGLTPFLQSSQQFCKWEFTPDYTSIVSTDIFEFISLNDSVQVSLIYTSLGGDCSSTDPNMDTLVRKIYLKQALFHVGYDSALDSLATLKRVIRSAHQIPSNHDTLLLGNLRFFWNFDEKMIPAPAVDYDIAKHYLGQYPNVYYTFPNGGDYSIALKVIDVNTPLDTALHAKVITLNPVFGTEKIDFPDLPNAITPGKPFVVQTSGTTLLSFKVFTRSGALVFETNANVISWDGKNILGNPLPDGIYYFILEDIGEKRYNPKKGFFYIFGNAK